MIVAKSFEGYVQVCPQNYHATRDSVRWPIFDVMEKTPSSRRVLLLRVLAMGAAVIPTMWAAAQYLAPRKGASRRLRPLGSIGDVFGSRMTAIVTLPSGLALLRRNDAGAVTAFSLTCSHAGCTVVVREAGFDCPCHGGRFDAEGRPIAGPPKQPLERLEVRIDNDFLSVRA